MRHLKSNGYTILELNFRASGGEIDIVARLRDEVVFVEVKTRSATRYGYPEEGVDFFKLQKIKRAIGRYILLRNIDIHATYIRFDIIAVQFTGDSAAPVINHIQNVELI